MAPTGTNEGSYSQQAVVAVLQPPQKQEPAPGRLSWSSLGYSCIQYAKARLGVTGEVWGTPNRMTAYDIEPYQGGLVITTEGPVGHVGYIESVSGTEITISEANYVPGKVTRRVLEKDSPVIRGYR